MLEDFTITSSNSTFFTIESFFVYATKSVVAQHIIADIINLIIEEKCFIYSLKI